MPAFSLTPAVFIFLGALAAGTSYLVVRRSIDARIGGLLAAVLWFVWGLSAWRVVTITDAGEMVAHNWGSLGYIGLAVAIIMALDWIMVLLEEADVNVRMR